MIVSYGSKDIVNSTEIRIQNYNKGLKGLYFGFYCTLLSEPAIHTEESKLCLGVLQRLPSERRQEVAELGEREGPCIWRHQGNPEIPLLRGRVLYDPM